MDSIKWLYQNREKVIKINDQNFYLEKEEHQQLT